MMIDANIVDNKLILTCDTKEDYGTIVDCLQVNINVIYKLKDTLETSPEGCLYKIANLDPAKSCITIEDISGKLNSETGNFKGIDQILSSLPPYRLNKKDALPCLEALSLASTAGSEEAKIGFKN